MKTHKYLAPPGAVCRCARVSDIIRVWGIVPDVLAREYAVGRRIGSVERDDVWVCSKKFPTRDAAS
jgi:hypothetical protein